jgi:glycosyltransferase involved in cell wall biosynthesis
MCRISVITVSFNAKDTINDCIRSVATQTATCEHILIDGASNDRTLEIVRNQSGHFAKIISEPDAGVYDAMNKGIRSASGEIVGILNADDMYYDSNALARVAEVFRSGDIDACYGDLVYSDSVDTNRLIRYWRSGEYARSKFYWGWMPPHPTFFVRRTLYEKWGMFRLDLGTAADYELMLRFLVKHGANVIYIPEILVKMRVGGVSNNTLRNRFVANKMDRRAWVVNNLKPYPWTLYLKPIRKLSQWFARPPH